MSESAREGMVIRAETAGFGQPMQQPSVPTAATDSPTPGAGLLELSTRYSRSQSDEGTAAVGGPPLPPEAPVKESAPDRAEDSAKEEVPSQPALDRAEDSAEEKGSSQPALDHAEDSPEEKSSSQPALDRAEDSAEEKVPSQPALDRAEDSPEEKGSSQPAASPTEPAV